MRLVRRLWTEDNVDFRGEHFSATDSTVVPRIKPRGQRLHPALYFGGASPAAERVAATEADVQLFWGEPLNDIGTRIERLQGLSRELGRDLPPLQFGLRVTTLVRDTTEQAWAEAKAKAADMARASGPDWHNPFREKAAGQRRLHGLISRGEVLDDNLYTTPGKSGGAGAATTWLAGSPQDVAKSLQRYADLGITHFVLSDTPSPKGEHAPRRPAAAAAAQVTSALRYRIVPPPNSASEVEWVFCTCSAGAEQLADLAGGFPDGLVDVL